MEHHKTEQDVKKNLEDIGFSEQEILLFFQYRPEEQLNFFKQTSKKIVGTNSQRPTPTGIP